MCFALWCCNDFCFLLHFKLLCTKIFYEKERCSKFHVIVQWNATKWNSNKKSCGVTQWCMLYCTSCFAVISNVVLFYKLFWTQACPEGIGTNGTHRSHARCHPYPIPQPVKVGHTTGVYVPYSFWTVVWVLLRPTRTDQWKCCEMGPTVFRPYPRRLESRTICRCHYKGSTFFLVI